MIDMQEMQRKVKALLAENDPKHERLKELIDFYQDVCGLRICPRNIYPDDQAWEQVCKTKFDKSSCSRRFWTCWKQYLKQPITEVSK